MANKKYDHSLKKSIMLASVFFVITISFVLSVSGYYIYYREMIESYQNYAGDAIDFIARSIDVDDLEVCIETEEKSDEYYRLQDMANDFKETHNLQFIYIIKPLKEDPPDNMMDVFAAWTSWGKEDGTDGLTDLGNLTGDLYPSEVARKYLSRMTTDESVTFFRNNTEFGNVYTAIRPLINSKGEAVAVICADVLIDDIYEEIFSYLLIAAVMIVIFGSIAIHVITKWYEKRVVSPIGRLKKELDLFEEKCNNRADVSELYINDPEIRTHDEIEALADTISSMVSDVQNYAKDIYEKENQIDNLKEYVSKVDKLAYKDDLTQAGNRAAYEKAKEQFNEAIKYGNAEFTLVMSDLNYLKKINDTYGHDKGNLYIQNMYKMISEVFKKSPIYRLGGDEFLIILQGDEMEKCREKVKIIKKQMKDMSENSDLKPWEKVSTSIGVATLSKEDFNVEDVLRRADRAMYKEKVSMHAVRVD